MNDPIAVDARYVAARRVLLDALSALAPHGPAVIVVGAQAVYLRTGASDLAIAPYTTDGDLAIDPALLEVAPELEDAMRTAGFRLSLTDGHVEPGIWIVSAVVDGVEVTIPVDLIVPEQAAPPGGRRGARLGVHGRRAARRAAGLEAALVDHSPMTIAALERDDRRIVEAEVAGACALLVAKAHKIGDRVQAGRTDRNEDKDAADVVRLMQTTRPAETAATLTQLLEHPIAAACSTDAIRLLDELFGRRGRPGIRMAARALRLAMDEQFVETLCVAYTSALRRAVGMRP